MKKGVFLMLLGWFMNGIGCMTAPEHAADVRQGMGEGDRVTVGTVQREIKKGMTNAEVIQVLGSPNIVSTDEKGREVWVYDKIATDRVYSTSSGGLSILGLAGGAVGGAIVGGGVSPNYNRGAGAESTSQRTLTIIIKYDEQGKVRDFAYHASKF
ncbi:MAG: hypothetical protein HZA01_16165 [Nitrospinae bacterium]|nr:hypothetical protein [Nitrospinota bacterium]